eukprot:g48394.t1
MKPYVSRQGCVWGLFQTEEEEEKKKKKKKKTLGGGKHPYCFMSSKSRTQSSKSERLAFQPAPKGSSSSANTGLRDSTVNLWRLMRECIGCSYLLLLSAFSFSVDLWRLTHDCVCKPLSGLQTNPQFRACGAFLAFCGFCAPANLQPLKVMSRKIHRNESILPDLFVLLNASLIN